jgi:hypothetical protein
MFELGTMLFEQFDRCRSQNKKDRWSCQHATQMIVASKRHNRLTLLELFLILHNSNELISVTTFYFHHEYFEGSPFCSFYHPLCYRYGQRS